MAVSLTSNMAVDCTRLVVEVGTAIGWKTSKSELGMGDDGNSADTFLAHVDADSLENFANVAAGVPMAAVHEVGTTTVLEIVDVDFCPMARDGATAVDDTAAGVHLIDMLQ